MGGTSPFNPKPLNSVGGGPVWDKMGVLGGKRGVIGGGVGVGRGMRVGRWRARGGRTGRGLRAPASLRVNSPHRSGLRPSPERRAMCVPRPLTHPPMATHARVPIDWIRFQYSGRVYLQPIRDGRRRVRRLRAGTRGCWAGPPVFDCRGRGALLGEEDVLLR